MAGLPAFHQAGCRHHVIEQPSNGTVLAVANFESGVGFAWWLMEHYWATLAHELHRQGRRCLLAYPAITSVPEAIRRAPIELVQLDWGERGATAEDALESLVRSHGITGIYLTDRKYRDPRYGRLRRLGVRRIVVHDHTPGERPAVKGPKGWFKRTLHRWGGWSADRYVGATEFVRERMVANGRVPRELTTVVPNGIWPTVNDAGDRPWARGVFGASEGDVVIGMAARAHPVKGIDFALRCAKRLAEESRGIPVKWVYVGDGPQRQELQESAARLGLGSSFVFLGRREDVRRLMAGMDIGFHPSRREVGYCLAVLELMDASLPVVVPDLASVRGATEDGETGMLYEPENEQAAVAVIQRLASDPGLRSRIGGQARARVGQAFSMQRTTELFIERVAHFV